MNDDRHANNFDLLRLLAALVVVGYHLGELTKAPEFHPLVLLGARAPIQAFFIISGYLIFRSYENTAGTATYFRKRAARILPGYLFVIVLAVVIGAAQTTLSLADYFGATTLRYLLSNLLLLNFLQSTLPGVFTDNPWTTVNGSLWTIKVEVFFYLSVPVFVRLFRRLGRDRVIVGAYLLSALWHGTFTHLAERTGRGGYLELANQAPGQLVYFLAGAAVYYHRDVFRRHGHWFLLAGICGLAVRWLWKTDHLDPVAMALVTLYFALVVPRSFDAARLGDMSYGIYLLHFPLIQAMVAGGSFRESVWRGLAVFVVLLIGAAQFSWHFVERPFLRRG